MALILNIDTATSAGSVCLSRDGVPLAEQINMDQKDHAAVIAPLIKKIVEENLVSFEEIDAVALSGGPGSYTGLRVAASTAKGLCYAWNIPLIAINTLKMMANGMKSTLAQSVEHKAQSSQVINHFFCPMIDARRMEVFTALYNWELKPVIGPAAVVLDGSFLHQYRQEPVSLFGSGMLKAKKLLAQQPASWHFYHLTCKASYLAPLAEQAFKERQFQDVAYFEPFYLKSFWKKA